MGDDGGAHQQMNSVGQVQESESASSNQRTDQRTSELCSRLGINDDIVRGLHDMSIRTLSKFQSDALPILTADPPSDVICQYHYGVGKTTICLVNLLNRLNLADEEQRKTPQAVILVHNRRLALQTAQLVQAIGRYLEGLVVEMATPSVKRARIEASVVVGTPWTVHGLILRRFLDVRSTKQLMIDKIDILYHVQGMSDQCSRVKRLIAHEQLGIFYTQVVLVSATWWPNYYTTEIKSWAYILAHNVTKRVCIEQVGQVAGVVKQLYIYFEDEDEKSTTLSRILDASILRRCIIFVKNFQAASDVRRALNPNSVAISVALQLDESARHKAIDDFCSGNSNYLITRSDLDDIDIDADAVINYDMPGRDVGLDSYIRRSRYASRFYSNGFYISFVASEPEREFTRDIQKSLRTTIVHTHAVNWTDYEFVRSILQRPSRSMIPTLSSLLRPSQIVPRYKEAQNRTSVDGKKMCNATGGTLIEKSGPDKSPCFAIFEDEEGQPENTPDNGFGRTDDWIQRFKRLVASNLESCEIVGKELISDATSDNRIKVAILDSGIDMTHISIRARKKRIKEIRTWTSGYLGAKTKGEDKSGHGTHIAGIILDLAPNVDIYIAQVTEGRELDDTRSISQALEYSFRTWDVDIITMSFGFQTTIPEISKQIKDAIYEEKILFAAASNDGGNSKRAFPASDRGVICIHSTDSKGNKSPYNPPAEKRADNFSILGQYIESCWPSEDRVGSRRMSGTSFATPVAVALAAFMIGYIREKIPDLDVLINFKSDRGISALFRSLFKETRDGYDYLAVFGYFEKYGPSRIQSDIEHALL